MTVPTTGMNSLIGVTEVEKTSGVLVAAKPLRA